MAEECGRGKEVGGARIEVIRLVRLDAKVLSALDDRRLGLRDICILLDDDGFCNAVFFVVEVKLDS